MLQFMMVSLFVLVASESAPSESTSQVSLLLFERGKLLALENSSVKGKVTGAGNSSGAVHFHRSRDASPQALVKTTVY